MIAKLIELCARNRLMVLLLTGFVVAGGIWTLFNTLGLMQQIGGTPSQ